MSLAPHALVFHDAIIEVLGDVMSMFYSARIRLCDAMSVFENDFRGITYYRNAERSLWIATLFSAYSLERVLLYMQKRGRKCVSQYK